MTTRQPKPPSTAKNTKPDRQKRLGTALRENLRKRKSQSHERQKSKILLEPDPAT